MPAPGLAPAPLPPRYRVVFLGTPDFAVPILRALLAAPGMGVALVVTQPDRPAGRGRRLSAPPVKVLADAHGLDVFQPERLRGEAVLERLRAANADLFAIAAYGQLLREAVLAIPPCGTLNVHPSLLPRHRGPSPVATAILAGDEETGVTIMLTDRGMDTGPILAQETTPLGRGETTASLAPRLAELGADLLVRTIPAWVGGAIAPRAQDEAAATVSRLFTKADGAIDWTRPAIDLERQVRALNPWPRAHTFAGGRRLQLLNGQALADERANSGGQPGSVGIDVAKCFLVQSGDGLLRLDEVQAEGQRAVAGRQYLANNPALVGTILGRPPAPGESEP